MGHFFAGILLFVFIQGVFAAEVIPPAPSRYFNDYAHVVSRSTADRLNEQLAQFERDTSNQIVVAIYPSLPEGADLAQYCTMTGTSWITDRKNGRIMGGGHAAILFVFINSHKIFILPGRDLEGALPDITCDQIIRQEIAPAFRQNDYVGGLRAGIAAMMAATKGEYKGNGQTSLERSQQHAADTQRDISGWAIFVFILLIVLSRIFFPGLRGGSPYIFSSGGYGSGFGGGWGSGGGGGGGGSSGFGGFSGGTGGGFSGGGAGGSW